MKDQQQKVMELVVFKLKPGTDHKAFKEASAKVSKVIETDIPGFMERSLLHTTEEDQWVDVVYWETMEHALEAINIIEKNDEFQLFVSMIDMKQTSMYHLIPATT